MKMKTKAMDEAIIPAEPGWFKCVPRHDWTTPEQKICGVHYEHVLAWFIHVGLRMGENGPLEAYSIQSYPVIYGGHYDRHPPVLRSPTGALLSHGEHVFADEAEVVAYFIAEEASWKERLGKQKDRPGGLRVVGAVDDEGVDEAVDDEDDDD